MTKKKSKKKKEKVATDWYPAYKLKRNAKRRATYAKDENYRAAQQSAARENYRDRAKVGTRDCRASLKELKKIGSIRFIYVGRKQVKALTFSYRELAKALEYSLVVVYRMSNDGRLPKAVVKVVYPEGAAIKPCGETVYTEKEVRAIIAVLGAHQERLLYYSTKHTETMDAMEYAVQQAREGE